MVKEVIAKYKSVADKTQAVKMKAYMRDQFEFYGVPSPIRKEINRPLFLIFDQLSYSEKVITVKALWKEPHRELQYFAMEAISRKNKTWPREIHSLFDHMILKKSWWDTVDFIAPNCFGSYLKLYPEMKVEKLSDWQTSTSFWMHRTALLFQLKYKTITDQPLLFQLCKKYSGEQEFFIRKAIGWALREYSKTKPSEVRKFIGSVKLSPLSVKEGSKYC